MQRQNLVGYIAEFAKRGEEIAIVHQRGYRRERWSYSRMARAARYFAQRMADRGIVPGDRVVLWGANCAEWVAAFWGCLGSGAVAVPLDRASTADFVRKVGSETDARLLFHSRDLQPPQGAAPTLLLEIPSDGIPEFAAASGPMSGMAADAPAEIIFTSGTTSDPRGVVLTHRNLLANLEPLESEIARYLKYERPFHPLRFLCLVPLSHVFGQFMGIFVPPLLGATVVFQEEPSAAEIIRNIRSERVSVLAAVPGMLQSLKRSLEEELSEQGVLDSFRMRLREAEGRHVLRRWWRFRGIHRRFGWKFWAFVCGGAALDLETETFWSRLGYLVIQGYGMTETASLISLNHPMRVGRGSIGQTLPGRQVRLSESGEIQVRGENVAAGYWMGKTMVPLAGEDGWFSTGDLGTADEQGNLYFRGRSKNVLVTPEGMNIYPEDLEQLLKKLPGVRDCVVVGLAQGANAEPCAVLILSDTAVQPESLIRTVNAQLAPHQQIRRWCRWPDPDFPRTPTRKPRLSEIHNYVQAYFGGSKAVTDGGELQQILSGITGRTPQGVGAGSRLAGDLNLSSLERVELISVLEQRYRLELDESRFTPETTVSDLERMLTQPAPDRAEYAFPEWPLGRVLQGIRFAVYYLLCLPAIAILAWPKVIGRERLRAFQGPALVVCNHITRADIGFILAALPPRLRHRLAVAMEGERLEGMRRPSSEKAWYSRLFLKLQYFLLVSLLNTFPLPQASGFRRSFAFAGRAMDRGYNLLVFPEGQLTRDGLIAPFRKGIGLLAMNLNVPVIPMRIDGLFQLKKAGRRMAAPHQVRVTIGEVRRFDRGTGPAAIARELEDCVRSLSTGQVI